MLLKNDILLAVFPPEEPCAETVRVAAPLLQRKLALGLITYQQVLKKGRVLRR
jgi:hypothetical protein